MLEIVGLGSCIPEKIVTNFDLEKIVDTNNEWIVSRTGIKQRHFAENESNSYFCSKSAEMAINSSKEDINIDDIKVVIVSTFTPDYHTPSVSCMVAKELNLREDIICFDLNAACSGFMYALKVAESLLKNMDSKYALVIGGEIISRKMDMSDKSTCILFGDGAAASIVKLNSEKKFDFISGTRADDKVLNCPLDGKIQMEGQSVYKFATEVGSQSIKTLLERNNLSQDDIKYIVCHQANLRIIDTISKRTKIDRNKFFVNLHEYGNTSAASIPIALKELWKNTEKGDKIICVGFGAGLTYGGVLLTV